MITHDLGWSRGSPTTSWSCTRTGLERADVDALFAEPRHPYTRGLLGSLPRLTGPAGELAPIAGTPPSPLTPAAGCPFHPRCPDRIATCETVRPDLEGTSHQAACHLTATKKVTS